MPHDEADEQRMVEAGGADGDDRVMGEGAGGAGEAADDDCMEVDVVIVGQYQGAVEGLGVDLPEPPQGAAPDEVPMKLLAESEGEAVEGVPRVRVWAVGDERVTKYWDAKGTEEQEEKLARGEWLPMIVANELYGRMVEEGRESVPPDAFVEEACNDTGDSVLVAGAHLFHWKQGAFRKGLRATRGLARAGIRRFLRERVRPRSTKKVAETFVRDCVSLDGAKGMA